MAAAAAWSCSSASRLAGVIVSDFSAKRTGLVSVHILASTLDEAVESARRTKEGDRMHSQHLTRPRFDVAQNVSRIELEGKEGGT